MAKNNSSNEEMDTIVTLLDEDGQEVRFDLLDVEDYEGREYVVLMPLENSDGEVTILRTEAVSDEDGMETYVSVEEEATLEAVFQLFKEKYKDVFDFGEN